MQELVRNAVNGWYRYTDSGKYPVLFLAALVLLWFLSGKLVKEKRMLLVYATAVAALAVCPLTAVLLMIYQTKFYDYEWIWSAVPLLPVIAWGMTEVYREYLEPLLKGSGKGFKWKVAGCGAAGLILIILCGSMGTGLSERTITDEKEKEAAAIVDILTENGNTEDICVWAPQEILQYVRGIDGNITLLYGRNMWEEALNAYAYDTYEEQVCESYRWMEDFVTGEGISAENDSKLTAVKCLETAFSYGVNCMILPEKCEDAFVQILADAGKQTVVCEGAGEYLVYWFME